MAKKIETIPDEVLTKSGLHKDRVRSGQQVVMPDGVDDNATKFQKSLSKMALWGNNNSGTNVTSNEFLNLFNYYLQSVLESKSNQRLDRYEQMDFIIENDPALAMTRRVLVDEMLQIDTYNNPINVTSPNSKFKKAIEKLFKDLGIKSYLREIASNLISYGDAFMLLDIRGDQGVHKLIPVDPRDVRHRFEFSIAELKQNKVKYKKRFTAFQAIIDLASTIETQASQFNKFLLGFQVLNTIFPFWQILHFRQFTTRNTIAPFGKPTFYESQSEARMYLNAKVIVSMIRSSAFMREHIKVKSSPEEDPSMQWEKVTEVKQMMEMFISGSGSRSAKDYPSFGERYYYPEGLISVEKMEAGYNFRDRFEDLDMMRQDVFTSTGLPKDYFVGGSNVQYVSNKSLIAQDKKAARQVFTLQNFIADQLIKLVEVHFSFTKEFDPYNEEFAISLPYPVPDTDDSVIALSTAKMQYVTGLISSLKQTLDITRIPLDVVKELLVTYFPLDDISIDKIVQQMVADSEEEDAIGFNRIGLKAGDPYLTMAKSSDVQVKMADIQAKMAKDQAKMLKGQAKAQDQQITMQQQQMDQQAQLDQQAPIDQQAQMGQEVPQEGSPEVSQEEIQQIYQAIQSGQYDEAIVQRALELGLITEEEYQVLIQNLQIQMQQQQQQPQVQMQEPVQDNIDYKIYKQNIMNEAFKHFIEATKKKPLKDTFESILCESLMEKGEEFTFNGRHYLTNKYVSPDRNISEYMSNSSIKDISSDSTKDLMEGKVYKRTSLSSGEYVVVNEEKKEGRKTKKFSVNEDEESDVSEDLEEDRRYSRKKKKTVL